MADSYVGPARSTQAKFRDTRALTSMQNPFAALGLVPALSDLGYETPTPIQTAVIPAILEGRDVRASARTGSGKTLAFVLPTLQRLAAREENRRNRPLHALVLVPTRELAAQIAEVFESCARQLTRAPKVVVAVGGVSINPQMLDLRGGADIVVATPGRLLELVEKNALHIDAVETLVLDEADHLLSLGFRDELDRIFALIDRRQRLLFSATFPPAVDALVDQVLLDPVTVDVDEEVPLAERSIVQRAIAVDEARRTMLLQHLLATEKWSRVLVFVASRYATRHIVDKLTRRNVSAVALHGEMSQGARTQALAAFKAGRVQVLVATDIGARGLDIPLLPAVVSYDLPRSATDHVHRIGRTGRAGETGAAICFVTADTEAHLRLIEKRNGFTLEREHIAGFEPTITEPTRPATDPAGGIKGRRKSKKDKLREAAAAAVKVR